MPLVKFNLFNYNLYFIGRLSDHLIILFSWKRRWPRTLCNLFARSPQLHLALILHLPIIDKRPTHFIPNYASTPIHKSNNISNITSEDVASDAILPLTSESESTATTASATTNAMHITDNYLCNFLKQINNK